MARVCSAENAAYILCFMLLSLVKEVLIQFSSKMTCFWQLVKLNQNCMGMATVAKMGSKHIQNVISEHFQLVECVANGYFESQLFYLSFLIQVN